MTRKAWEDWQARVGETSDILVFSDGGTHPRSLFTSPWGNRILHASFDGDKVTMKIERKRMTLRSRFHVENETVILSRDEIKSVKYKK